MHVISSFKRLSDAHTCARAGKKAAPSAGVSVSKRSSHEVYHNIVMREYIGAGQQKAIAAIKKCAGKMEIRSPHLVETSNVAGHRMDPRIYASSSFAKKWHASKRFRERSRKEHERQEKARRGW